MVHPTKLFTSVGLAQARPNKTLHLVARRYYMVPTQGGVSFPLECGLFYCLLLLPGIMSDQNTTMLAQPPYLSDICQITHQQL